MVCVKVSTALRSQELFLIGFYGKHDFSSAVNSKGLCVVNICHYGVVSIIDLNGVCEVESKKKIIVPMINVIKEHDSLICLLLPLTIMKLYCPE